jgi:hypothetical protein
MTDDPLSNADFFVDHINVEAEKAFADVERTAPPDVKKYLDDPKTRGWLHGFYASGFAAGMLHGVQFQKSRST